MMDVRVGNSDSFYSTDDDKNNNANTSMHKNSHGPNGTSNHSTTSMTTTTTAATTTMLSSKNTTNDELGRSHRTSRPKRKGSLTKTDIFANESMTSFRVSRRSKLSPDDLMPTSSSRHHSKSRHKSNYNNNSNNNSSSSIGSSSKHGGGLNYHHRNHDSFQSFNTTSSEGLEGSIKTLILEEHFQGSGSESDADLGTSSDTQGRGARQQSQHGGSDKGGIQPTSNDALDPNDSWMSQNSSQQDSNDLVAVLEEAEDWKTKWLLRFAILRASCGNFVNSMPVQVFMSIIIVGNAILLGALTYESLPARTLRIMELADLAMLGIFTFEIILHAVYLGVRQLIKDSWLVFDSIVILMSWVFLGSSLAVLRSFRIFRVFSLFSRWESLRTLFEAIGSTLPKMASIWLSLLIFFYIFCVLFTALWSNLYAEGYLDYDYFGNLGQTFVTLFQVMTLDNWVVVARQVMVYQPWSFLAFFVFILFSSFFIVNLVVAVICESLIQISRGPPNLLGDTSTTSLKADDADDGVSSAGLEIMMRQMLKNQSEMAATIRGLQQEISSLREGMTRRQNGLSTSTLPPPPKPPRGSLPLEFEEEDSLPVEYTTKLRNY